MSLPFCVFPGEKATFAVVSFGIHLINIYVHTWARASFPAACPQLIAMPIHYLKSLDEPGARLFASLTEAELRRRAAHTPTFPSDILTRGTQQCR